MQFVRLDGIENVVANLSHWILESGKHTWNQATSYKQCQAVIGLFHTETHVNLQLLSYGGARNLSDEWLGCIKCTC